MKSIFHKKLYLYLGLAILSLGLALTSHVSAQQPDAVPLEERVFEEDQRAEVREMIVDQREDVKDDMKEQRAKLSERTQNRIINLARNMIERIKAAMGRIDNIATRMETRIEKLSKQGINTDAASAEVEYTRNALNDARDTLETLDADVQHTVFSDSPKENFKKLREAFTSAKNSVQSAHTHLLTALNLLKDAVREAENGARDTVPDQTNENLETQ